MYREGVAFDEDGVVRMVGRSAHEQIAAGQILFPRSFC